MSLTYQQIVDRLGEIEGKIGERQDRFEDAARRYFWLLHKYDLEMAKAVKRSDGKTATAQKADALVDISENHSDLYNEYNAAQAEYEALKAILASYDKRAMIGMALLKSQTRESGPQPSWGENAVYGKRAA